MSSIRLDNQKPLNRFTAIGLLALASLTCSIPEVRAAEIEAHITVTASRVPTEQMRSGNAVEIITRTQILKQNPGSLADLLRRLPGLSVSQQSGLGGLTQIRMRGKEANHILVLVDGIEANDVSQGSEFNFSQFPVHQIDRIEVVYGAESAVWGSDAVAGVIHIMTRSAYTDGTCLLYTSPSPRD